MEVLGLLRPIDRIAAKGAMRTMPCPVCLSPSTDEVIRSHSIIAAAEHFVPAARSLDRNKRLIEILNRLWKGAQSVEVHRCRSCGFGFPIPYVAGDIEFYNVAYGESHYPRDRWEFRQTIAALELRNGSGALLEVGAGEGWFLKMLQAGRLGKRYGMEALEYDRAAIMKLQHRGFTAREGSIADLLNEPSQERRFAVICLFQTLEHMDRIDDAFRALRYLLADGGSIFISVPFGPGIDEQERVVEFWDMPPVHVGRWLANCFEIIAARHGLRVVEGRTGPPLSRTRQAWHRALSSVAARATRPGTVDHRINAVAYRPVRGALKLLAAGVRMPRMWLVDPIEETLWVHLSDEKRVRKADAKTIGGLKGAYDGEAGT